MSKKSKTNGTSVRLSKESAKILETLLAKANNKDFGRRISAGEIVNHALNLVDNNHINHLQESSRTREEKLRMLHERYCMTEVISKEKFLDKLMNGDIPKNILRSLHTEKHLDVSIVSSTSKIRVEKKGV